MIQFYNQWICTKSNYQDIYIKFKYIEGQLYYFHEDAPPPSKYFVLIVDENDFPVKVMVRG
jgi:hypothetical protein